MRFAFLALVALSAVASVSARSLSFEPSDDELLGFVARNGDSLPAWIRANPTRDVLRAYLTHATVDISVDGKLFQTIVIDGPESQKQERERLLRERSASEEAITPSSIWAIGKAVWNLIMDNKATVNATVDWAGAIPKGVTSWTNMTGWETSKVR